MHLRRRLATIGIGRFLNSDVKWAIASQILTSGANFGISILIIKLSGLIEFGRFSVAFLALMMARNFLTGVVLAPMSVIAPKLSARSQPAYRGFLILGGVAFAAASALVLAILASAAGLFLAEPWLVELAIYVGLANFAMLMADFFRRYEFVKGDGGGAFSIDLLRYSLLFGLFLYFVLSPTSNLDASSALIIVALSAAVAAIYGLFRFGRIHWRRRLYLVAWVRHKSFIKWMSPFVALEAFQANAPLFAGVAIFGESALGGVRALMQLANLISMPISALQQVAPSLVSRAFKQRGQRYGLQILARLGAAGAAFLAASAVAIFLFWAEISSALLDGAFRYSLCIFILYAANNFINLAKQLVMIFFQVIEQPEVLTSVGSVACVATVAALWALLPHLDVVAVPAVSLLANAIAFGYLSLRFSVYYRYGNPSKSPNDRKS